MNEEKFQQRLRCYRCQRPGVYQRNCPTCNDTTSSNGAPNVFRALNVNSLVPRLSPKVSVSIAGLEEPAVVDTAACNSVASARLYKHLLATGHTTKKVVVEVTFADGNTKTLHVPTVQATVNLAGRETSTKFLVLSTRDSTRTLLGADFIEDAKLVLDLSEQKYSFSEAPGSWYPFLSSDMGKAEKTTGTKPLAADDGAREYGPSILTGVTTQPAVHDGRGARKVYHGHDDSREAVMDYEVELSSRCYSPIRTHLATLHLRPVEGASLPEVVKEQLNALLDDYVELFANTGPPTPLAEHRIDTGDSAPIASPSYRLAPGKTQILYTQINAMLEAGIIEECESAWASPVVLVPKPDGSSQVCVDYRRVNAITKPDTYPLPRLDDLVNTISPVGCISTLDLQAGYWQIQIRPEDRDKTAFVCPFGMYRFLQMPFGLRNAPASFQRLIDRFKTVLPDVILLAYLDDLIVFSPDPNKHLDDLRSVLALMRKFRLRMNRDKCAFGCTEVKYLGHRITTNGVGVNPDNVLAVSKMPAPKNPKELQFFLQTCSGFQQFLEHFATTSGPLSTLLKDQPWDWGPAQREAFQTLREQLTSPPVLRTADPTQPFILRTGSSVYAFGAALLQGDGPEERPIEYASRLLNATERNYSATERGALAIVWAINKFRGYVRDASVVVITDHQPLRWLMDLKSPMGRLTRWALQLQPYNISIEYTPGPANALVDMLSRPAIPEENKELHSALRSLELELPRSHELETVTEQLKDPDLKKIIDALTSTTAEVAQPWLHRGYFMNNGVLYHYSQDSDEEAARVLVPSHERSRVLKEYHDSPTAGHDGVQRTYHRIQERYYWPGMRRYITDYLKNCQGCQRYQPHNLKPASLPQTPVLQQRMEVVAIDLVGPLPLASTGERWVLIIQDYATRWVELFALVDATADEFAWTIVNEFCLRYGIPRKIISDSSSQFVSAIMQKVCFCLDIDQEFTPDYHPEGNPVESPNRDLKTQLALQIGDKPNSDWPRQLPSIRFAMNTVRCQSTGKTPAFLLFGSELRSIDDVTNDLRSVVLSETFVPGANPRLLQLHENWKEARKIAESNRQPTAPFQQNSPTSYDLAGRDKPTKIYHFS
jgi:hypothetical protein